MITDSVGKISLSSAFNCALCIYSDFKNFIDKECTFKHIILHQEMINSQIEQESQRTHKSWFVYPSMNRDWNPGRFLNKSINLKEKGINSFLWKK